MIRLFHILVVLTVAVLWLGGPAFAATPPRIALVIGNSNYQIAPSLPNPANDAKLMAETLRGLGFDVIERIDADRETMLLATFELQDRLIEAGKEAVGLFYYAGHGVQVAGENYFIPLNTNIVLEREVSIKAVSASFVLKQMEFAGNGSNFVILDACRNNPFPASTRAATRGLARMDAPTGSLVAYSTGPGSVAADGTGDNGPYVLALTEAMKQPGIPAELMFKRVREKVLEATNDQQTPWEESSLKGADFYFTAAEMVATKATATVYNAAATEQESLFWQSIKDTTDPEMFEAYLAQYPVGTFAVLARLRIKQFGKQQEAAETLATAEAETRRLATEQETQRQAEAKRLAAAEEAQRLAVEAEQQQPTIEQESQTALLAVAQETSIVIDKDALEDDESLKAAIKNYVREARLFTKRQRVWEIDSFHELAVKSISGTTFIATVSYEFSTLGGGAGRSLGIAKAEIEKTANSYKIINFRIIKGQ